MEHHALADGAVLAWTQTGHGDPLLLVAGQSVTHRSWDPLLERLSREFRVLTFDHRGIGASTLGDPTELSTRSLADDAAAVLDAAGAASAHVWGHSLGGRVAQWLAIRHPDRVDRLVLGATTGGDARGSTRPPWVGAALVSGDPARLAPLFFTGDAGRSSGHAAVFTASGAPTTLVRLARASRTHDAWPELHRIRRPTLVQHGTDDLVTAVDHAGLLADAVPGARLDLHPGLRHGYHLESAAAVEAALAHLRG